MNTTKTQKLLRALKNGAEVTANQAMTRYGFESENSFQKAVSNLRTQGYVIYANRYENRYGFGVKYRIGPATRKLIAAGYKALRAA